MKEIYESDISNVDEIYANVSLEYRGLGTQSDPWRIRFIEDLVDLSESVNDSPQNRRTGEYFSLVRDLDFKQDTSYKNPLDTTYGDINADGVIDSIKTEMIKNDGKGFIPIGDETNQIFFNGTFSGNGHRLNNIMQNDNNLSNMSIFIGATGTVSNFAFTGTFNGQSVLNGYVTDDLVLLLDGRFNTRLGYNNLTTSWEDLSGNNKDGVLNGGVWQNNGLTLDGADDGVNLGNNLINLFKNNSNTIEVKVKFAELNTRDVILGNFSNPNSLNYEKHTSNNSRVWVNAGSFDSSCGNIFTSNTTIYTTTYVWNNTQQQIKQYINGVYVHTFSSPQISNFVYDFGSAWLGRDNRTMPTDTALKGDIYSCRVYDKILTDGEILNNYNVDISN